MQNHAAPVVYTVPEFCEAHRISRAKLYVLWQSGKGPRRFTVGNKILITAEDAAEWRHQRVAESPNYEEDSAEWRKARATLVREIA